MSILDSLRPIAIKFVIYIILSPLIGYIALEVVQNLEKAKKIRGMKKGIPLAIAGFLIAVLLGWLR